MKHRTRTRNEFYYRGQPPYRISKYEKDNANWHSSERFRWACIWFIVLSGLGALLLWAVWP